MINKAYDPTTVKTYENTTTLYRVTVITDPTKCNAHRDVIVIPS